MKPRTGRVIGGRIVLDDNGTLVDGSRVLVWVGDPGAAVRVNDEELALIRQGQDAVDQEKLVDARAFLHALREAG